MNNKILRRQDIKTGNWYCIRAIDNITYLYQIQSLSEEIILYSNLLDGVKIWIWKTEKEAVEAIKKNAEDMATRFEMLAKECEKRLGKIEKKRKKIKIIKRK